MMNHMAPAGVMPSACLGGIAMSSPFQATATAVSPSPTADSSCKKRKSIELKEEPQQQQPANKLRTKETLTGSSVSKCPPLAVKPPKGMAMFPMPSFPMGPMPFGMMPSPFPPGPPLPAGMTWGVPAPPPAVLMSMMSAMAGGFPSPMGFPFPMAPMPGAAPMGMAPAASGAMPTGMPGFMPQQMPFGCPQPGLPGMCMQQPQMMHMAMPGAAAPAPAASTAMAARPAPPSIKVPDTSSPGPSSPCSAQSDISPHMLNQASLQTAMSGSAAAVADSCDAAAAALVRTGTGKDAAPAAGGSSCGGSPTAASSSAVHLLLPNVISGLDSLCCSGAGSNSPSPTSTQADLSAAADNIFAVRSDDAALQLPCLPAINTSRDLDLAAADCHASPVMSAPPSSPSFAAFAASPADGVDLCSLSAEVTSAVSADPLCLDCIDAVYSPGHFDGMSAVDSLSPTSQDKASSSGADSGDSTLTACLSELGIMAELDDSSLTMDWLFEEEQGGAAELIRPVDLTPLGLHLKKTGSFVDLINDSLWCHSACSAS